MACFLISLDSKLWHYSNSAHVLYVNKGTFIPHQNLILLKFKTESLFDYISLGEECKNEWGCLVHT